MARPLLGGDNMANFASLAVAEQRAVSKTNDGTWMQAHVCLTKAGSPAVRFLRKMTGVTGSTTEDGESAAGAWDVTIDDAVT